MRKMTAIAFALLSAGLVSSASAADPALPEGSTVTQGGLQPDTPAHPAKNTKHKKHLHRAPIAGTATNPPSPVIPPPSSNAPWPNGPPPQSGLGGTPPPPPPGD